MIIQKEMLINKNIEPSWKVLGHGFADAHQWASPLKHSSGTGPAFNGSACSERGCDISGMGKTREKLLQFSNETHSLSYEVTEGMPGMVKYATNSWQLFSVGPDKTRLIMKMNITLKGVMGFMMQPVMKMMMGKMGSTLLNDFKYYTEYGRPSAAKLKALSKMKN